MRVDVCVCVMRVDVCVCVMCVLLNSNVIIIIIVLMASYFA